MAKKHGVAIVLSSLLALPGWAATPIPSLMATTPQPSWSELAVEQKIILAPLSDDWDSLEAFRQKKWLGIAARFSSMTPLEQRRIQGQMQTWGKMTPDERETARRNFLTTNQLPSEEKKALREKWLEYSKLPADEKEKLMQQAADKPASRRLPPSSSPLPAPPGVDNRAPAAWPFSPGSSLTQANGLPAE